MQKWIVTLSTTGLMMLTLALPLAQEPAKAPGSAHQTRILMGCLQPGADANTFKLIDAHDKSLVSAEAFDPSRPSPVGTSGDATVYELKPASKTDLKLASHVGQKVEVTVRPIELIADVPPKPDDAARVEPVSPHISEEAPQAERVAVIAVNSLSSPCEN